MNLQQTANKQMNLNFIHESNPDLNGGCCSLYSNNINK